MASKSRGLGHTAWDPATRLPAHLRGHGAQSPIHKSPDSPSGRAHTQSQKEGGAGAGWAGRTLPHLPARERSRLHTGRGRELPSGQDAELCYLLPMSPHPGTIRAASLWLQVTPSLSHSPVRIQFRKLAGFFCYSCLSSCCPGAQPKRDWEGHPGA